MIKLVHTKGFWYMDQNGYLCSCKDITDPEGKIDIVKELDVEVFSQLKEEYETALLRYSLDNDSGLYVFRGPIPPIHVVPDGTRGPDENHPFCHYVTRNPEPRH